MKGGIVPRVWHRTGHDPLALSRLLDGDLSAPERAEVEHHLRHCRRCRETLGNLRVAEQALRLGSLAEPVDVPYRVTAQLRDEVLEKRRNPLAGILALRLPRPLAAGAIALVAVLAAFGIAVHQPHAVVVPPRPAPVAAQAPGAAQAPQSGVLKSWGVYVRPVLHHPSHVRSVHHPTRALRVRPAAPSSAQLSS